MALADSVHERLLGRSERGTIDDAELAAIVREIEPLAGTARVERTVAEVRSRLDGLGALDPLLADPSVTDVMVNGPGPVWVDRAGALVRTEVVVGAGELELAIERIVAPLGRRVDPRHPIVDGRLADGSRVHVVVPPLAIDGPYLTIRRFGARAIGLDELASPAVERLLREAVEHRSNIVVSGGTGSGKTTLLNALASCIAPGERIVTVEDAAELRLSTPHVVRLETRPPGEGAVDEVTCRDLVRTALRMRPDRVVVGEVRGSEAFDMVTAMNTGHDGSLSTVHANSCEDAMRRLEGLVLMAAVGLPHSAVRRHLGAAIDLVVHMARLPSGQRRVVEVAEVLPSPGADGTSTRTLVDRHGHIAEARRHARLEAP